MSAAETAITGAGQKALSRPSLLTRGWIAPVALFLIITAFSWKILLTNQYTWLESPDLAYQVLPWFQFEAQQFHEHRFPMWDPLHFGGQSLIGQDQPGLAYPMNWILFSMPLRRDGQISVNVLNWYYMLIHYLAALFCYLLCRELGRSRIASMLGGVSFGLGGYIGATDWPQMINGAVWAPLVFLFLFRAARGWRPLASGAFAGTFLGMSWLSGHHQVPIFLSLAVAGTWLYFLLEDGRLNWLLIKPAAAFAVFFLCAGALQMWPTFSYGHTAVRWVGSAHDPIGWKEAVPYTVHQQYSLSPIHLLGMMIPGYQEFANPFVGVVALALAGLALATWWNRKEVRILTGVGIAGLLLALAKNDVFHGILYSIAPLIEKARTPATALFLFHFAIAVLIAFGLDSLFLAPVKNSLRRLTQILLGFGGIALLILFAILAGKALAWSGDDRVMISVLAAFILAGLIYRASRNEHVRPGILLMILGLYMIELANVTFYYLPHKDEKDRNVFLKRLTDTNRVAEFLRGQPGPIRVWANGEDVPFNFGDWHGIDTMNGMVPSLPFNVDQLELHTPRTRMLYGAAYTISKKPIFEGQQEVFRDDNGLIVYKSPAVLPRAWTVHEGIRVQDPDDARRHLQDANFDIQRKTFGYTAPPSMEQCDGDTVQRFSRGINWARAAVNMKCRGMVVMSENNAPGWVATVDGKEAPIYDAYTTLRGVVVGPGMHTVETRYRPLSVMAGAAATFAAFFGALALWLIPKFRARAKRIQEP